MLQGRADELDKLNDLFERKESNITILYGDDHSGITSLWHEFAKGKDSVYFAATDASDKEQIYLWAKSLAFEDSLTDPYSYESLFEMILSTKKQNLEEKRLFIIDGLEKLYSPDFPFLKELHSFVEHHFADGRAGFVLLCKKSAFTVNVLSKFVRENNIRIAAFMKVNPLHFIDLVMRTNSDNFDQMISYYALLGGYDDCFPNFNTAFSLKQNIIGNFLLPNAPFRHYGLDIIKENLREPAVYASILCSLAEGRNKLNDLYQHLGASRAKISVYLKQLCELNLVEKVRSYDTPGAENTKKGVYRISNPIVKFYYSFIYPNESMLRLANLGEFEGAEEAFYKVFIEDYIDYYCMSAFPLICEEFLNLANDRGLLPIEFIRYGEWVGKTGTVNIIAQDKERNFLFGFCNPGRGLMTYENVLKDLEIAKETHLSFDYLYLFSLDGFEDKVLDEFADEENIYLVDRSDLQ